VIVANIPANEPARLNALRSYEILDTAEEKEFDEITALAARQFKVPVAVISLVDENRQWFKSHYGLNACETSRDTAFCAHTILQNEMMIVEDATKDARFAFNPLVTDEPQIRFYAGQPLTTFDGYNIGTLCLIDTKPRTLNLQQKQFLKHLTERVSVMLELRLQTLKLKALSKS
jgi:GAF domain-containing protein